MNDHKSEQGTGRRWLTSLSRRTWLIVGGVGVVVVAGLCWWLVARGGADGGLVDGEGLKLTEVVVTDLARVETFGGTLGFEEGDPITSRLDGTLTGVVEAGSVVVEGDVLYYVDESPVVLLYGDLPAFAPMPEAETLSVRLSGIITGIVQEGEVLEQGDVLATVDEEPVVVLYGDVPAYRALQYGRSPSEGADVEQLEEALVVLGYDPDGLVTVDEEYDWYTEQMVLDWQEDIGAPEDGRVDLGEVIFLAGEVVVSEVLASVGDSAPGNTAVAQVAGTVGGSEGTVVRQLEAALERLGYSPGPADGVFTWQTEEAVLAWQGDIGVEPDGVVDVGEVVFVPESVRIADAELAVGDSVRDGSEVLAVSGRQVVVTVDLPAVDQEIMNEGDPVNVILPDYSEAPGTVVSKSSVARRGESGSVTFDVLILLDDVSVGTGLDQAPVDVEIVTESRQNVLAVPVTALLALAEGGYAVEVYNADDGDTHLVAVEPGLYADGLVEVSSSGLAPGDLVVAP